MGFTQRPPTSGGLDPNTSPNLPIGDSAQAHDIPTGVAPSLAKLQDWTAWLRTFGVFYLDPVGAPGTIANDITIGGDLTVTGDGDIAGTLAVGSSAAIGTDLTIGDDLFVTDDCTIGDNLTVTGDAGVTGTLAVTTAANINGPLTLGSGANIVLSPARSWTRRSLRVCGTTSIGGTPLGGTHDSETLLAATYSGVYRPSVVLAESSSSETWLELDDLPDAATISQVVVRTYGDGALTVINTAATYRVVRWTDETTIDNMSATVNDSHSVGTWTTKANQTIAINANGTIDRAYRYAVIVTHHDTDGTGAMHVLAVVATGTGTSLRL